jgi:hypothetical protein
MGYLIYNFNLALYVKVIKLLVENMKKPYIGIPVKK